MDASEFVTMIADLRRRIHEAESGYKPPHDYMNTGIYPLTPLEPNKERESDCQQLSSITALRYALWFLQEAEHDVSSDVLHAKGLMGVALGLMVAHRVPVFNSSPRRDLSYQESFLTTFLLSRGHAKVDPHDLRGQHI